VSGSNLFAGTDGGGAYLSTDSGASWTAVNSGLPNPYMLSLAVSDSNIFAGTEGTGIFLSTNDGTTWTAVDSGFPANPWVNSLAVSGNEIFAGTLGSGVWRRPLSEMLSVRPQSQQTAHLQTKISTIGSLHSGVRLEYSIESQCLVRLEIYTISGRRVAVIENGEKAPGNYSASLDASRIPSGIYLYRFQAGSFEENSRLIVAR
jgi:hypothetical protein